MKVTFRRHVNQKNDVAWSCKIDGTYVTGDPSHLSWKKGVRVRGKAAMGQLHDFTNLIKHISDDDLRGDWIEK